MDLEGVILMSGVLDVLESSPVIAALMGEEDMDEIIRSSVGVVFIISGSLMNIRENTGRIKSSGKKVCIHADLIEGLGRDHAAIEFLKMYADPDGIITTKPTIAKYAKQLGMFTIQRLFIIDSHSLVTGVKNINDTQPDAVEVMPGIASKLIERLKRSVSVPIIAGGLVSTKDDVIDSLSKGAIAVSTSCSELWYV